MRRNWRDTFKGLSLNLEYPNPESMLQMCALAEQRQLGTEMVDAVVISDRAAFDKAIADKGGMRVDWWGRSQRSYQSYTWDWAVLVVSENHGANNLWLKMIDSTENFEMIEWFNTVIKPLLTKQQESHGEVYALMQVDGSLDLMELGTFEDPLVDANYDTKVVEDYQHVIKCLGSKKPCGRIALLNGPPGGGKSYMIRAIIKEVNATHVIIPGGLVTQLSSPHFLATLQGCHQKGRPTVLIIEDADMVVVDRKHGNLTALTDILNLGDGLLGHMLDVRVVASTNAKKLELDEAITRPGRLCRHVIIQTLEPAQAATIYKRLTEKDFPPSRKKSWKLAEIYRLAIQDGWVPDQEKPSDVGGNYA